MKKPSAGVVLYVGDPHVRHLEKLGSFLRRHALSLAAIYDKRVVTLSKSRESREIYRSFATIVSCDFSDANALRRTLKPFTRRIKALVCRGGFNITSFQRVIPFVPYVKTPTVDSLERAMNKVHTRESIHAYNGRMIPKFMVVSDASHETIERIKRKIGLPAIVKPAGLAEGFLIQAAFGEYDLQQSLKHIFRRLRGAYHNAHGHGEPMVLVEEYLEGEVYSIECFINSRGSVFCCPLVREITGREAGYDDFFSYKHLAPVKLGKEEVEEAELVTREAIHALGLRSLTAHVELIRNKRGWKIIEVNPRIGGFREDIYQDVYGIAVSKNDILVRMDRTPRIGKSVRGHSMVLKMYARKEGRIIGIRGCRTIRKLDSFRNVWLRKKAGDRSVFARNAGENVLTVWLHHKKESVLAMDGERVEALIQIEVN